MTPRMIFALLFVSVFFLPSYGQRSWKLRDKVEVKWGGQYYNAEIIDVKNNQYKIHYDGYGSNWDEWVTPDRIKVENGAITPGATATNGKYKIGQQVEAYNVDWYKATIIGFGSGNLAGYIRVHYEGYSSASDQYLKESSIRPLQSHSSPDYKAGPRNGRYIILSYGNISYPITIGYFDLSNGGYTYYDAAKKPLDKGSYSYNPNTKKIQWQSGPLKKYGADAAFEIDREGKTHKIRLNTATIGSNSLD